MILNRTYKKILSENLSKAKNNNNEGTQHKHKTSSVLYNL